ncbi:Hypothetical predicted protein [Mytilus galloprovincialis]|uniref:Glycosyltransferase 2-like domain-containing protein n=1 Tax=Mytilus galloprovincialis TaxID=29158 RepID=A0A8B6DH97_MYTGA|nr:Hypothetical predicted protein [Mytilus galloprovincialis]
MFSDINWGSETVFREQSERAKDLGISLGILNTCLNDVKCSRTQAIEEIIVSDGGSTDDTIPVVEKFAKTKDVEIKVIKSSPGRGFQQSYGAEQAKGDIFMFLHADTEAPDKFEHAIVKCLQKPGNVGGCFKLVFDVEEVPERYTC